jgi:Sulfotransferase family
VLSYPHSGAGRVQDLLAAGTDLACTSGTGIIPLSVAAAEAWRRVEGQPAPAMSRLAVSTIRGLLTAQVAVILAGSGKSRWCELVTAPPSAADPFLQVFPQAGLVCVHRSCGDVIRAAVRASPWGVHGPGLVPYFLSHPGNSVSALAAYWASSTEQLLAFEAANAGVVHRVRYEDVLADPGQALAAVRASLQLGGAAPAGLPGQPSRPGSAGPGTAGPVAPGPPLPVEMIPEPLRERIGRLHDELGYPPLGG